MKETPNIANFLGLQSNQTNNHSSQDLEDCITQPISEQELKEYGYLFEIESSQEIADKSSNLKSLIGKSNE